LAARGARSSAAGAGGDDCHAGHHSALAPAAHRAKMDVPEAPP
jgi:hypothetical protein